MQSRADTSEGSTDKAAQYLVQREMSSIAIEILCVQITIVVLTIDQIVVFHLLNLQKSQLFVELNRSSVVRDDMQIRDTTIAVFFNLRKTLLQ